MCYVLLPDMCLSASVVYEASAYSNEFFVETERRAGGCIALHDLSPTIGLEHCIGHGITESVASNTESMYESTFNLILIVHQNTKRRGQLQSI
jgi:hypothetical protein